MMFFIVFALSVLTVSVKAQANLLCSDTFCEIYLGENDCVPLPLSCNAQNSSHNGLFLPSPVPCNCCEYCLGNLHKDDSCTIGDPSSTTPNVICGDSLTCLDSSCKRMTTQRCIQKQDEYDYKRENGTLGHLEVRPVCDRYGNFSTYNCIPGEICYCVAENGTRIFGEIPYTSLASILLKCKCSRDYIKSSNLLGKLLQPDEFLRCQSNGDYDPLQCIGESCLCVDPVDGSPNFGVNKAVNISLVSNLTLDCFDNDVHHEGAYYNDCEALYREKLAEISEYEEDGLEVFGFQFPNCQLDGNYGAVQENLTSKYCSDPDGKVLESFILSINDAEAENMNCKCARTRSVMTTDEKPDCCKNGNYQKMQCRRGLCRCVDEDGNQIEKEVEYDQREMLSCFVNLCS